MKRITDEHYQALCNIACEIQKLVEEPVEVDELITCPKCGHEFLDKPQDGPNGS